MTLNEQDLLWNERSEAFEASGLNGAQWCRSQDIPVKQFRYWHKKLRRLPAAKKKQPAKWIAISCETVADALLLRICGSIKIENRHPLIRNCFKPY